MDWLVKSDVCPGLFYGTPAADGFLVRLRIPGGWLDRSQVSTIATILNDWDSPTLQVTNRGNLQLRGITTAPTLEMFQALQAVGLAAKNPELDRLRNFMASPTAGIDPQELIDTRPYLRAIDDYLQSHPELVDLPSKFSIGIDGGGAVGIGRQSPLAWEHRYNEIQLSAVTLEDGVYFHLALGGDQQLIDTQVVINPADSVPVIAALATVYQTYSQQSPPRQQRMKHLLQAWGLEKYLTLVKELLPKPLLKIPLLPRVDQLDRVERLDQENLPLLPTIPYQYWGVHPQSQSESAYVGVNLILGKLTAEQWTGLGEISTNFGKGELRLTPWQSVLIPDIKSTQVPELLVNLEALGLSATRPDAAIVACAGKPGCAASATDTQTHARLLADELSRCQKNPPHPLVPSPTRGKGGHDSILASPKGVDRQFEPILAPLSPLGRGAGGEGFVAPVNIHLTGCAKSCAQASPAEITLLGRKIDRDGNIVEGYDVYVGDGQQSYAQQIYQGTFAEILPLIRQILDSKNSQILDPQILDPQILDPQILEISQRSERHQDKTA